MQNKINMYIGMNYGNNKINEITTTRAAYGTNTNLGSGYGSSEMEINDYPPIILKLLISKTEANGDDKQKMLFNAMISITTLICK